MRITYLPHARERMESRGISEEEVEAVLAEPDAERPGDRRRTVAERTFEGRRLAVKVVYNQETTGSAGEIVVVMVERGRPSATTRRTGGELSP